MFEGVSVAVVTPFRNGDVDEAALGSLVEGLVDEGVDGIVATGSTGEAATLSRQERRRVVAVVVEAASGRAFTIAGTGTNNTAQSIELSRDAKECGVDGIMVVTPYYNKPSPSGLVAHFETIIESVALPVVAYNVPSRTGYNLTPPMAARLGALKGVVALKEASGSVDQAIDIRAAAPDLTLLSGEDSLTLPLAAIGALGVISVVGHLVAGELKAMLEKHAAGDVAGACVIHERIVPVIRAVFLESNPGPVKYALSRLGRIANELRPPMAPVSSETAARIDAVLRQTACWPGGPVST